MKFLIVDDDESIHLYLQSLLGKYAQCDSAPCGEDGIALFEEAHVSGKPYDVVFMDILMPGIDGHQTAGALRDREQGMGIGSRDQFKLVMITSLVDDTNVSKAFFNSGALCYIVKPLEKNKVLEELRQNLIIE